MQVGDLVQDRYTSVKAKPVGIVVGHGPVTGSVLVRFGNVVYEVLARNMEVVSEAI